MIAQTLVIGALRLPVDRQPVAGLRLYSLRCSGRGEPRAVPSPPPVPRPTRTC